jgi:hypothetical protein
MREISWFVEKEGIARLGEREKTGEKKNGWGKERKLEPKINNKKSNILYYNMVVPLVV